MRKISVKTGDKYDVIVGENILCKSGEVIKNLSNAQRAIVVTDDIVFNLYYETIEKALKGVGIEPDVFVFPNGEQSKSHEVLINLYEFLADEHITRSDILIALGGGVVGDLTGFAAATYLRGIDFVQIPTTLLAQTDSSIGGKTGVNIANGKNLVGAFKQPLAVICDTNTIKTLLPETFADGMSEIIKYGVIRSKSLFDKLDSDNIDNMLEEIIAECIEIKRDIVENDEFDKGERMLLNYGHTIGHAIERHYNYIEMTHGKAVAIGMCMISHYAEKNGLTKAGETQKLIDCLKKYNLPTSTDVPMSTLIGHCLNDKKRDSGSINIILSDEIGKSFIKKLTVKEFYSFLDVDFN